MTDERYAQCMVFAGWIEPQAPLISEPYCDLCNDEGCISCHDDSWYRMEAHMEAVRLGYEEGPYSSIFDPGMSKNVW